MKKNTFTIIIACIMLLLTACSSERTSAISSLPTSSTVETSFDTNIEDSIISYSKEFVPQLIVFDKPNDVTITKGVDCFTLSSALLQEPFEMYISSNFYDDEEIVLPTIINEALTDLIAYTLATKNNLDGCQLEGYDSYYILAYPFIAKFDNALECYYYSDEYSNIISEIGQDEFDLYTLISDNYPKYGEANPLLHNSFLLIVNNWLLRTENLPAV